ncbi:MAG TPA: AsmA family protein [Steroidobacteraceae bacterium]|nr:AsmA family protein [Steroidobacteraceae bacterium]
MRALRIAAYAAAGLIGLIVVALVLVLLFVDPNDYRDDIQKLVKDKTGRELTLSGDLKLSVFPWIALESGPATLGDAPGFGPEPFVALREAHIGVRLLPLLRGKVEVGNVRLDGARIRLITDEQGRENWADLGKNEAAQSQPQAESGAVEVPTVAGLEISDAAVVIENRQAKSRREVRDFNLKTGRLASGEPFDFSTDFVLDQDRSLSAKVKVAATVTADLERNVHRLAEPKIDVTVSGQGYPADGVPVEVRARSLEADIGKELYRLDSLAVKTTWKSDGLPAAGVPLALNAKDCNVNLASQTLELAGLEADAAGAHVTGSLTGAEILDAPSLKGSLKLDPLALREWLPKLGIAAPKTTDPKVLEQLSFSGNVQLTKASAEVGDIVLKLDDTTMRGMLGVADFASKALRFDLNVDRINADRYLPPSSDKPAAKDAKQPPTEIPVDMLRKLNARGQLSVGEAIFAGMTFTKLRLGVNAREGKVRFYPSEAAMYGGQYRGDIGIDATGSVARVTLDEHVSGVSFAPLFKDLFETTRVSGKGSANIKLAGAGRNTDDLMKTLDGTVDFNVADGALEGADLWYEIRRARALLKRQAAPERAAGPPRTPFSALTGTGTMKDGVLTNNDLNVAMQYLKVTGQGNVDLPRSALDYRLVAAVLKIPREGADTTQMEDMVDAQIPVKVSGSLSDPKVRPDVENLLKGEVKKKVEEKIKDKLGDKLKDIFKR